MKIAALPLAFLLQMTTATAQVHYHKDGNPWKQRAGRGPDAEVDGWYYNLGITGIRVELIEDAPDELLVKHVFAGSPADRKVLVGDHILGAAGRSFEGYHQNGYGMEKFGAEGPISEFAHALEESQGKTEKGKLKLSLRREEEKLSVELNVGQRYGTYGKKYPSDCKKTERILDELYEYLVEQQRDDGSWGSEPNNTFAPLDLLARGERK